MKKIILLFAASLYSTNIFAVTLNEALTSGYNNHDDFKTIRADFLNEIEAFPKALSEFMPRISANIRSSLTKTTLRNSSLNQSNNENNSYARSIALEQPIFNGGGSVAALKAAQSAFRSARAGYYSKEQELILNEINSYLNCVEAKKKHEITKLSIKSNLTQLEAMKEKFKLGESTETEVAQTESRLATAEANQTVAYANLEAAKANFYRFFNIEANDINMPNLPEDIPTTLEELLKKVEVANLDVDASRHNTTTAKAQEYVNKSALLPRVSVRIEKARTYFNPQSNTNSGTSNNDSVNSTLSVTIPILERGGAEYSDIRRSKNNTRKTAAQLEIQRKKVLAESKSSWESLNAARMRIVATAKAIKAAEVAYDGIVQEEMLGSKTVLDMLITEEQLNKAREANVEAHKELILAGYRIKALTGNLTAKSLKLPVEYFNPEKEFKKIKFKIVGF